MAVRWLLGLAMICTLPVVWGFVTPTAHFSKLTASETPAAAARSLSDVVAVLAPKFTGNVASLNQPALLRDFFIMMTSTASRTITGKLWKSGNTADPVVMQTFSFHHQTASETVWISFSSASGAKMFGTITDPNTFAVDDQTGMTVSSSDTTFDFHLGTVMGANPAGSNTVQEEFNCAMTGSKTTAISLPLGGDKNKGLADGTNSPVYLQVTSPPLIEPTAAQALATSAEQFAVPAIAATSASADEADYKLVESAINDLDGSGLGASWVQQPVDIYTFPALYTLKVKSRGVTPTDAAPNSINGAVFTLSVIPLVPLDSMIKFFEAINSEPVTLERAQQFVAAPDASVFPGIIGNNPWFRCVGAPVTGAVGKYVDAASTYSYSNFGRAMSSMQMLFFGAGTAFSGIPGDKAILYPTNIGGDIATARVGQSALKATTGAAEYQIAANSDILEIAVAKGKFTATRAHYNVPADLPSGYKYPGNDRLVNVGNVFLMAETTPSGASGPLLTMAQLQKGMDEAWKTLRKTADTKENRPCIPFSSGMETFVSSFNMKTLFGDSLATMTGVTVTHESRKTNDGASTVDMVTAFEGEVADAAPFYAKFAMALVVNGGAAMDNYLTAPSLYRYQLGFCAALLPVTANFWPYYMQSKTAIFPPSRLCTSGLQDITAGTTILDVGSSGAATETSATVAVKQRPYVSGDDSTPSSKNNWVVAGILGQTCDADLSTQLSTIFNYMYNGHAGTMTYKGIKDITADITFSIQNSQGNTYTITIPQPASAADVAVRLAVQSPTPIMDTMFVQAVKFQNAYQAIGTLSQQPAGQQMLWDPQYANMLASAFFSYITIGSLAMAAWNKNTPSSRYMGCIAGEPANPATAGAPIATLDASATIDYTKPTGGMQIEIKTPLTTSTSDMVVNFTPHHGTITENTSASDKFGLQALLAGFDTKVVGDAFYGLGLATATLSDQVFPGKSSGSSIVPSPADGITQVEGISLTFDFEMLQGTATLSFSQGVQFSVKNVPDGAAKQSYLSLVDVNHALRPAASGAFDGKISMLQNVVNFVQGQQGLLTAVELGYACSIQNALLGGKVGAIYEKTIKVTSAITATPNGYLIGSSSPTVVSLKHGPINDATAVTQSAPKSGATADVVEQHAIWKVVIQRDPTMTALFKDTSSISALNNLFNDFIKQIMNVTGEAQTSMVMHGSKIRIDVRAGIALTFSSQTSAERINHVAAATLQWKYNKANALASSKMDIPIFKIPASGVTTAEAYAGLVAPIQLAVMSAVDRALINKTTPFANTMMTPGYAITSDSQQPTIDITITEGATTVTGLVKSQDQATKIPIAASTATWQFTDYYKTVTGGNADLSRLASDLKSIFDFPGLTDQLGTVNWKVMRIPIIDSSGAIDQKSILSPLNPTPQGIATLQFKEDGLSVIFTPSSRVDIGALTFAFVNAIDATQLGTTFSSTAERRVLAYQYAPGLYTTALLAGQSQLYSTPVGANQLFVLPSLLGVAVGTQRKTDVENAGKKGLIIKNNAGVSLDLFNVDMSFDTIPSGALHSGSGSNGRDIFAQMIADIKMPLYEMDKDADRTRVLSDADLATAFTAFHTSVAGMKTQPTLQDADAPVTNVNVEVVSQTNLVATTTCNSSLKLSASGGSFKAAFVAAMHPEYVGLAFAILDKAFTSGQYTSADILTQPPMVISLSQYMYAPAAQTSFMTTFDNKTWYMLPQELGGTYTHKAANVDVKAVAGDGISQVVAEQNFSLGTTTGLTSSAVMFKKINKDLTIKAADYGSYDMRGVVASAATKTGIYVVNTVDKVNNINAKDLMNSLYGTTKPLGEVTHTVIPQKFEALTASRPYRYAGQVKVKYDGTADAQTLTLTLANAVRVPTVDYYPWYDVLTRDLISALRNDSSGLNDLSILNPSRVLSMYYMMLLSAFNYEYLVKAKVDTEEDIGLMSHYASSPFGKTKYPTYDKSLYQNALVVQTVKDATGIWLNGTYNALTDVDKIAVESTARDIYLSDNVGFFKQDISEDMWNKVKTNLQAIVANKSAKKTFFHGLTYVVPSLSDTSTTHKIWYTSDKGIRVEKGPGPHGGAGRVQTSWYLTITAGALLLWVLV